MIRRYNNPRQKRHARLRGRIAGTAARPRLSIFRSNTSVFCQLIDDEAGRTVAAVNGAHVKNLKGSKTERAAAVGAMLADKAKTLQISEIVFDRSGYAYHGRVKAVAEQLRQKGLKF